MSPLTEVGLPLQVVLVDEPGVRDEMIAAEKYPSLELPGEHTEPATTYLAADSPPREEREQLSDHPNLAQMADDEDGM